MKNLFTIIRGRLAEASLLELGAYPADSVPRFAKVRETIEDNLVEIAFAEAADYDQIHDAIAREKKKPDAAGRAGDCIRDDHGLCAA